VNLRSRYSDGIRSLYYHFILTCLNRSLRTLFLEECDITNNGSGWLHELCVSNSVLVSPNFYMTELKVEPADLELLAKNCKSLISLKIGECDLSDLIGFFQTSKALEEFAGGAFYEVGEYTKYEKVKFPPRLCLLGLTYMGTNEICHIPLFCNT
jgi:coronatine-insensitive protein 1